MREPPGYRETLEWVLEKSDGKGWLKAIDIAEILGVDRSTVRRKFGITGGCAAPVLAMILTEESMR